MAAKKPAKKKVAKPRKKANGTAASHREAVIKSWSDPKVAKSRSIKHRVRVGGQEYRSVLNAFEELGLPIPKHQAFRRTLKELGSAKFEGHNFKLIT